MFNYFDIYDSMENPLNKDLVKYFINCFSKNINIYSSITLSNTEACPTTPYDDLYYILFSRWKSNILNLNNDQIDNLIHLSVVNEDFYNLIEDLKQSPKIRSKKEFENLVKSNSLFSKYNWQFIDKNNPCWIHINSSLLNAWKERPFAIEHKLCINCNPKYTEQIVFLLIEECLNRKLPFHIKFDKTGTRSDSIVIYSDTKNLKEYIEVARKTRVYNKDLFYHVGIAPMLTGKIEEWLGYASEIKSHKKMSFNQERSNLIYFSIKKALNKWIYDNSHLTIQSHNKDILFHEYLSRCLANVIIKKYEYIADEYHNNGMIHKFFDEYGLTLNQLTSPEFKEYLTSIIDSKIFSIIYSNYKREPIEDIIIKTNINKRIIITYDDFKKMIRQVSIKIANNFPSFIDDVYKIIEEESLNNGIDINKFCFDIERKETLFAYQNKVLSKK